MWLMEKFFELIPTYAHKHPVPRGDHTTQICCGEEEFVDSELPFNIPRDNRFSFQKTPVEAKELTPARSIDGNTSLLKECVHNSYERPGELREFNRLV